jgi:hydrogenase maturation protein HypF
VSALQTPLQRTRVRVTGTVQGVGFRPFVYRLAHELGLVGWVLNDSHGVLIELEGEPAALDAFLARLGPGAPPLAILEAVSTSDCQVLGATAFQIHPSPQGGTADAPVSVDSATCVECLEELVTPSDRRYRYPFINCTNCGPRFTIVQSVPYDRPLTTMKAFTMCPACQTEYDDPADRRFHAQPNACPECGPTARLVGRDGREVPRPARSDPVQSAAIALRDGAIVAIKGIGGYHLACRADKDDVVEELRARKHREDKPFALMVGSVDAAGRLVMLGEAERELLTSPARPIVLAPRIEGAAVAHEVAPGARELGVMLPYSPLHHLLLDDLAADGVDALVLTSGNVSDEPIAFADDDARARLSAIADLFLIHDRPIETRTDDSVARVVSLAGRRQAMMIRRSRGYVPAALTLPGGTPVPLLATGAELKHTFCLAKGPRAWVSHHIGDLQNYETLRSLQTGVEHFQALFAVTPEAIVHDLHPDYLSSKYALERDGVRSIGVQHHHAHLAACLAEHGEDGPALGAIFDGTGYGSDGTVWGGELLFGDLTDCERVGMLRPARLPGGERAIREPWRMACAWLVETLGENPPLPDSLRADVEPDTWEQVARLAHSGFQAPVTTSMGRLFDAVAALIGVRARTNYEGQAAIELEACCDDGDGAGNAYPLNVSAPGGTVMLDPRPTIVAVLEDLNAGTPAARIAGRFHAAVAEGTVQACALAAAARGTEIVVLSGGVFANRRLLEATAAGMAAAGLRVLVPQQLPPGDGGISYGQAAVAAARLWQAA